MVFDLDQRTASLSVGEFSGFTTGPHDAGRGGAPGLWRAQLGTHWHNELRARAAADAPATEFEVPIAGRIFHRGWTLTLNGRIDQLLRTDATLILREIKTVTRALPADEAELRSAHPDYFAQLAAYVALTRLGALSTSLNAQTSLAPASATSDTLDARSAPRLPPSSAPRAELVFVEVDSGLSQTVVLPPGDDAALRIQLERVTEFLALRLRARERLRHLAFRPAFATPRPGQETTLADLTALFQRHPLVFFEAPTGFGKTGVLLEFALGQLRAGHFDRALYLTSKSTGQLQVVRTLQQMTAPQFAAPGSDSQLSALDSQLPSTPLAAWHVRNKAEHCVNTTFHCVRESCAYLDDLEARWPASGLARFYLDERHPRDLDTLRAAGRAARICPYEITRASLAFNDLWIGDYNYVFAPANRGLFYNQPGFDPARSLLLIDEAHNLPARVADALSHAFTATDAHLVASELHRLRPLARLVTAWDHWCHALAHLRATDALSAADEDDLRHLLGELARILPEVPLDYAALDPRAADILWQIPAAHEALSLNAQLSTLDAQPRPTPSPLAYLFWSPRDGELALTCLDAAPAIAAILREFGGVVLASATLSPPENFSAALGLDAAPAFPISHLQSQISVPHAPLPTPPDLRSSNSDLRAAAPARLGDLTKRETKKLYRQLTSAADLLRVEEARDAAAPALLRAHTPWRDGAYDVAVDARVDTTFQHRSRHYATTAATVAALCAAASQTPISDLRSPKNTAIAVFFPSYAYAETIARHFDALPHPNSQPSTPNSQLSALNSQLSDLPPLRLALQPRARDLAAQAAWVEESLLLADALFLVLGSSFAESIDLLGGRIGYAMVVGPALPEVNAVQRARLAHHLSAGPSLSNPKSQISNPKEAAFRRVYQIPGMTKVNQALGRLVRAPGQRARVLLHCRRFLEPGYASLLAPEYQLGANVLADADLAAWLAPSQS